MLVLVSLAKVSWVLILFSSFYDLSMLVGLLSLDKFIKLADLLRFYWAYGGI